MCNLCVTILRGLPQSAADKGGNQEPAQQTPWQTTRIFALEEQPLLMGANSRCRLGPANLIQTATATGRATGLSGWPAMLEDQVATASDESFQRFMNFHPRRASPHFASMERRSGGRVKPPLSLSAAVWPWLERWPTLVRRSTKVRSARFPMPSKVPDQAAAVTRTWSWNSTNWNLWNRSLCFDQHLRRKICASAFSGPVPDSQLQTRTWCNRSVPWMVYAVFSQSSSPECTPPGKGRAR